MSRYSSVWLGLGIVVVIAVAYLVYEVARPGSAERQGVESIKRTEKGQFTAQIVASRRRTRPGEIVSFKLELVDSNGRSQRIPASARSGQPPRMTLHDSQGKQIGTYSFRYG